jgi:hypothetical protein
VKRSIAIFIPGIFQALPALMNAVADGNPNMPVDLVLPKGLDLPSSCDFRHVIRFNSINKMSDLLYLPWAEDNQSIVVLEPDCGLNDPVVWEAMRCLAVRRRLFLASSRQVTRGSFDFETFTYFKETKVSGLQKIVPHPLQKRRRWYLMRNKVIVLAKLIALIVFFSIGFLTNHTNKRIDVS